ncbi:unnamed protein product [Sphagnum balticum]
MLNFSLAKSFLCVASLSLFVDPCTAIESAASNCDSSKQDSSASAKLTDASKKNDANSLSVSKSDLSWMTHAISSYQQWQQGNVYSAITEGNEAVKLNPDSPVALINLALMKQRTSDYDAAIELYWRAAKLLPDSWVPPLGIARCYILSKDETNSQEILQMMSEQKLRDFNWYFGTAKTWLEIKNLSMAETTAKRASEVAVHPEQKAAAQNLQLLALLRAGSVEKAKSLEKQVFFANSPRDPELYVRAAALLLPAIDPAEGEKLLDSAIKNLSKPTDAEVFLKLGTIFQDKADDTKLENAQRSAWLQNAQAAFAKATAMSPNSADYHFALAGAYSDEGDVLKSSDELKKSSSIDPNDLLAPFLISKLLASKTTSDPTKLTFSLVKFKIEGLTCSCHLSKIHGALRALKGVAFISTPPQNPFTGLVLVDRTLTPPEQMISKCNNDIISPENDPGGHPIKVKLELISEEPINSVGGALKIARDIRFGPPLSFDQTYSDYLDRFQEIKPILPVDTHGTISGASSSLNWSEPL